MKLAAVIISLFFAIQSAKAEVLDFDVYLDDSKIGYHRFEISGPDDGVSEVTSTANFDVKFLFITAFRYRHANSEQWSHGCLEAIDADTNSNGKQIEVTGEATASGFVIRNSIFAQTLPGCVMTFAYWDPRFLQQDQLLNPQTGEYIDVDIEPLGSRVIAIDGNPVSASGYKISGKDVDVTVWYSSEQQWISLESPAKGGRVIRYELS